MIREHDERCTGCTACMAACPSGAIAMLADDEGFLFPSIDKKHCIDCGFCSDVCPINMTRKHPFMDFCYGMAISDKEKLKNCSSGGVFSLLADYVLHLGGVICGCVIDQFFVVRHIISDNPDIIRNMYRSKYVQSNMGTCFAQVNDILQKGRPVLFTGTPCQVSGLRNYLNKDYDNLLTMDFVCHGVPSPAVFKSYVDSVRREFPQLQTIEFRDKSVSGWGYGCVCMTLRDMRGNILISKTCAEDPYMAAFENGALLRTCCYACQYATPERVADITAGDFWGIWNIFPNIDTYNGISFVKANTSKGLDLLLQKKNNMEYFFRVNFNEATRYNIRYFKSAMKNVNRGKIFDLLKNQKENLVPFMKKLISKPVGIFNYVGNYNYGTTCQNYALSKTIEKLGYKTEMIHLYQNYKTNAKSPLTDFRLRNMHWSEPANTYEQFLLLSEKYEIIVSGSDQIWHDWHLPAEIGMLAWAYGKKTLIAYASSFGDAHLAGTLDHNTASLMLKRFDAVSVREDSGVEICRQLGIDAIHLLDPVFLLEAREYDTLISTEVIQSLNIKLREKNQPYILTYFVADLVQTKNLIDEIKKNSNLAIIDISTYNGIKYSLEEWLFYIKNCEAVITDSFHGTCFSIIYHKQFMAINTSLGADRIPSLLRAMRIHKNCHHINSVTLADWENEPCVDYSEVDSLLGSLRYKAIDFLRSSLTLHPKYKPEFMQQLLLEHGVVKHGDMGYSVEVDRNTLFSWSEEVPFDASLKIASRSPFRLAAEYSLRKVPYIKETNPTDISKYNRKIAYELLLADAHRILDKKMFSLVADNRAYQENPHLLNDFLKQTVHDLHQKYLFEEAKRLSGRPVYFFGCGKMYHLKKNIFAECEPRCIIMDWVHSNEKVDGLRIYHSDNLNSMEVLPIIIFGSPSLIVNKLKIHHPNFTDLITCALI